MGIEALPRGVGVPTARLVCDDCARSEVIACSYEGHWKSKVGTSPSVSEAHRKAASKGWSTAKRALRCPACVAKQKVSTAKPKWLEVAETEIKQEAIMSKAESKTADNVQPIRSPSPEQRGDIIEMLVASYDRKAKRYRAHDTDKTVADAVGGGCMPGWVAQIREENFGPSGENAEMDAIRADIEAARAECDRAVNQALADMAARIGALSKRIDAVCTAVGPRAARA